MAKLHKLRFVFVYPLVVLLFIVARTTERAFHLGLVLVMLGEAIRFWANGYVGLVKVNLRSSPEEPKVGRLMTAGPYAFVRHPLYLGTLLIGAGFCVIVGNLWFSLAALGCFLVAYRRKMRQEEAVLRAECGTPYLIYQAAVPRLLPTLRPYPTREGQWSWRGIAASQEWKTLTWVIVVLIGIYFREEFVQEREPLFSSAWHVILFIIMLLLMAGDGLFELLKRRRQANRSLADTPDRCAS